MRLERRPLLMAAVAATLLGAGCGPAAAPPATVAAAAAPAKGTEKEPTELSPGEIEAAPPPFSEGIFPCTQCHEGKGNPTRRTLEAHEDIQAIFSHDATHRWCLDCHDNDNRDVLRLASGVQVPFTESYRLCGQCHGDKYRDWRAGVHGKRTGHWNGPRTYLLCVHCHNPHSPRFKPLKPEPRPQTPVEITR